MQHFNVNEDLCEHQRKKPTQSKKYFEACLESVKNNWGVEFIHFISSVCSMSIIVIVLACYNGKPQSKRPSSITLNALVAVFFTISKGLMISCVSECIGQHRFLTRCQRQNSRLIDIENYDAASRGVIGAFWLLLKPKVARTSFLGAGIIVAALAIDPFAQQLVKFPTREVAVSSDATLAISTMFPGIWGEDSDAHPDFWYVFDTWWDDKDEYPPRYTCPSDHCYWPSYLTIGFCSECKTLTHDLDLQIGTSPNVHYNKSPRVYHGNLPNGHRLSITTDHPQFGAANITTSAFKFNSTSSSMSPTLLEFTAIEVQQGLPDNIMRKYSPIFYQRSVNFRNHQTIQRNWEAYQCTLSLCIQQREASTRNGHLRDRKKSEEKVPLDCNYTWEFELDNPSQRWCIIKPSSLPSDFKWSEGRANYRNSTKILEPAGWIWPEFVSMDDLEEAKNCFMTEANDFLKSQDIFKTKFNGRYEWTISKEGVPHFDFDNDTFPNLFYNYEMRVPEFLELFASRMTHALRVAERDLPSSANGTVYKREVYVEVTWIWLLLPTTLLCCTLVFLLSTIRQTKQSNARPWKSSSLPLLLDGLEFSDETDYSVDNSESEERAGKTPLILHRLWRVISNPGGQPAISLD